MRLLSSTLLVSLLLTGFAAHSVPQTPQVAQNIVTWQAHLVQQEGQPKHRGSGRRELISLSYGLIA